MAKVYAFQGIVPVIDPTAFVHPDAVLIGDVIVGAGVYVGPGASLRGDFGRLILEAGVNFQDNCIMHGTPGTDPVIGRVLGRRIAPGQHQEKSEQQDARVGHGLSGLVFPAQIRLYPSEYGVLTAIAAAPKDAA